MGYGLSDLLGCSKRVLTMNYYAWHIVQGLSYCQYSSLFGVLANKSPPINS